MSKKKRRGWPQCPQALPHPIIDNHTHLPVGTYEIPRRQGVRLTLDAQLARAYRTGVKGVITCACEIPDMEPSLALARRYCSERSDAPSVALAVAIHPNEAALHAGITETSPDGMTHERAEHHSTYNLEGAVDLVERFAQDANDRIVAIGETGLDYFRTSQAGKEAQKTSFAAHIELAKKLDMPMQIHDRDAHQDTLGVLQECGAPEKTVFHCFSGDADLARKCADQGWYCSFSGTVTFGANDDLREAVASLPRELVLVETDAPYLTPHPHRGQPNASYMIAHTLRCLAEVWGVGAEEASAQLVANTFDAYPRLKDVLGWNRSA